MGPILVNFCSAWAGQYYRKTNWVKFHNTLCISYDANLELENIYFQLVMTLLEFWIKWSECKLYEGISLLIILERWTCNHLSHAEVTLRYWRWHFDYMYMCNTASLVYSGIPIFPTSRETKIRLKNWVVWEIGGKITV